MTEQRDARDLTLWHVVAFLGELVVWGAAAWAGWSAATGGWKLPAAVVAFLIVVVLWAVFAAPRARGRLSLWPRLVFIAALGAAIGVALVLLGSTIGAIVALAATAAVVVAQMMDERTA